MIAVRTVFKRFAIPQLPRLGAAGPNGWRWIAHFTSVLQTVMRVLLLFVIVQIANGRVVLAPPTFPSPDTVRVTLSGADTNRAYSVLYATALSNSSAMWPSAVNGTVGQTVFDINIGSNSSLFFRAAGIALLAIEGVSANGGVNTIKLNVSTNLNLASATNISNYSLSGGIAILGASLSPDGRTITLTTSALSRNTTYTLSVTDLVTTNGGILVGNTSAISFNCIPSLIGQWRFDESPVTSLVGDSSVNNRNGNLVGGVRRIPGISGNALSFNGTNGYIEFGNVNLNLGTNFTISFFMQSPQNRSNFRVLLAKGPKTSGHYEVYLSPGGEVRFYSYELGDFGSGRIVDDSFWHHVSIAYDGATVLFYIDGAIMGGGGTTGVIASSTARLVLGALSDTITYPYNGCIDELQIFNRNPSSDELNNGIDFVAADNDPTKIKVAFKNPVDLGDSTNPMNYVLSGGISVSAATLSADGRVATLNVPALSSTNFTTLTVKNMRNYERILQMIKQSRTLRHTPNLIQHWTFDDYPTLPSVRNSVVSGYDGILSGTSRVVGQRLKAIGFNGLTDYVDMGTVTLNLGTEFSMAFWIKAPQNRSVDRVILAKGPKAGGHLEAYLSKTNGSLRFYAFELGDFGTASAVDDTNWHHVVVTYNASRLKLYLDGLVSSDTSATGAVSNIAQRLILGAFSDTVSNRYNGYLDDLRIYSTVLAGDQVAAMSHKVVFPQLSTPWGSAPRIVQSADGYESDFLMIKDHRSPLPYWHSIGIHYADTTMYHAEAPTLLTAPYANLANIGPATTNTLHMWAPCAIWKDANTCWTYYCDLENTGEDGSIRVYESTNLNLSTWRKLTNSSLEQGYISFRERLARDPEVSFDSRVGQYVMWYISGLNYGVSVRTSTNLVNWTGPDGGPISVAISSTPDGFTASESPNVVLRNGIYYMLVSGFDYGRVAVYASEDPLFFGDGNLDKLGEISGHAVQVVTENGVDYIGAAAVASSPGHGAGWYDIQGVRMQQLNWVPFGVAQSEIAGLIGCWKLDEGNGTALFDSSASGYNGTVTNATWTLGRSGTALSYGGSSNCYVSIPTAALNIASSFTIAAWVKVPSTSGYQIIVAKGAKGVGHYEVFLSPTGEFRFYANEIGDFGSGRVVTDNAWHHLAVTCQGGVLTLYVDGVSAAAWPASGAISATTDTVRFGILSDGTFSYRGVLDQVRVYNRGLASAEIQALNNAGL